MRHLFTPLYWLAFLAIVAVFAFGLWTLGSDAGSRWLVDRLATLRPGTVTVADMHGNLVSGPTIGSIAIRTDRQHIELRGISVDYRLAPLRQRRLRIRNLEIETLHWQLPPASNKKAPPTVELPVLHVPFDLLVERLHIGRLVIERPGKTPLTASDIDLRAAFRDNRLLLSHLKLRHAAFNASVGGTVDFTEPPSAQLGALVTDGKGGRLDLAVTGQLQDYRLSGVVENPRRDRMPAASIAFSGSGNLTGIDIDALKAETMSGSIVANGKIRWLSGLRIDAGFSGSGIEPGTIDPRYPGKVSFGGQAHFDDGRLAGQFAILGEIRHHRFRLESDAELEGGKLRLRQGRLVMGPNRLGFTGELDRKGAHDLTIDIALPRPEILYPPLTGKIEGSARLDGDWRNPRGNVELRATTLRWRTLGVDALTLDLTSADNDRTASYRIEARGLKQKSLRLATATLLGSLGEQRQTGRLRLRDPARKLKAGLDFSGAFDRRQKTWRGVVEQAMLTALGLPEYRQKTAAPLTISPERLTLAQTCLAGGKDELCLDADLSRHETSRATLRLARFPLKRLAPWYPLTRYLRDTLDARIDITGSPQRIESSVEMALDDANRLVASASLLPDGKALDGRIEGSFTRLQWLTPLSEGIMTPTGRVELALTLGGTLPEPSLRGELALKDGSVRLPAAGIQLKNIAIRAVTRDGKRADIDGSLQSGEGKITIEGQAQWPSLQQWRADILLRGKDFLAARLPVAKLWISPQLQIAATAKRVDVVGEVEVPKAEIRIKRIPETAITPTGDVYFIDAEAAQQKREKRFDVYSRILLQLGDDVHLSGYGLNTDLAGKLLISEAPGQAISGDGSFRVVDGYYEALGQKLEIERGEIYWNGPLDEPALNLRAVRKAEGVTTGLEIRGPILHPESRIFSDPPMDETNALAYLLTGKPFGATSGADSNMLLTAVARLGLKGSTKLVDDLRRRAGLDVLAIQPGEDIEQSTLVIGKYLSARFYLEYTTSLFEDASVLSIRYRLNRHLQLEAESSDKRQSIDLIYEIER